MHVFTVVCVCVLQPHHDQVDQGHCVEADAPQPHDPEHVDQDHGDGEAHQGRRPQLEAQQHGGHHQDGAQRHAQVERRVVSDGQVLLIEHVEDAAQGDMRERERERENENERDGRDRQTEGRDRQTDRGERQTDRGEGQTDRQRGETDIGRQTETDRQTNTLLGCVRTFQTRALCEYQEQILPG